MGWGGCYRVSVMKKSGPLSQFVMCERAKEGKTGRATRPATMARVLGLDGDNIPNDLQEAIAGALRPVDEAAVLPGAHRSVESGAFKNVVLRLDGAEPGLSPDIFSPNWFSGISVLPVPERVAEAILRNPTKRKQMLRALSDSFASETTNPNAQIGPPLESDDNDADKEQWTIGFDSSACCVGLYSANELRRPQSTRANAGQTRSSAASAYNHTEGMQRNHKTYYLVAKAGGGVAAQTFHQRLSGALAQGATLNAALSPGGAVGAQALRRVAAASERNRARMLLVAAEAIGFTDVDSISDQASPPQEKYRAAMVPLSVSYNTLRQVKVESAGALRTRWQYHGGCVDAALSTGIGCASNAAEGFLIFTDANGGTQLRLRNYSFDSIPFTTPRLATNRDAVTTAAEAHCQVAMQRLSSAEQDGEDSIQRGAKDPDAASESVHPDAAFLRNTFGWLGKRGPESGAVGAVGGGGEGVDIEPPPLWGTFASEAWTSSWSRELGLAHYRCARLTPEIVALASVDAAKLRAARRFVQNRIS